MASASDVPNRFDIVINGEGYVYDDSQEVKAELGQAPTFIPRQNVQGDYGDNQQDFWLTATQRDWSEGEQQRYFRQADEDSKRRYWHGTNIDISEEGEATIRPLTSSTSNFGTAVQELAGDVNNDIIYAAGATNLYEIGTGGIVTDRGAHGVGAQPTTLTIGGRTSGVYLSTTDGAIRLWNGSAFSTFAGAGTAADQLAFLNNTLYGLGDSGASGARGLVNSLNRYDTAGTRTTLFTWKNASGASVDLTARLIPFGGKLLIMRSNGEIGTELWLYDGTGVSLIARLPNGFVGFDIEEVLGSAFVGGLFYKRLSGSTYVKPAIFYYSSGTLGLLWKADTWVPSTSSREPRLCAFAGGLVFTDDTRGVFMLYAPDAGGVSTIGTYTTTDKNPRLRSTRDFFLHSREAIAPYRHPADGFSSSGTLTTSLIDFDSSLDKRFHGIKLEFDSATDGNGGSVDVAYRLNDPDGSFTTLQTGAVSGTEYELTNISGRSISVKVTLNRGTSTAGPVLKRIAVKGSPIQPAPAGQPGFVHATYVLNCTGTAREPDSYITLRDGTQHGKSGLEMVADLRAAVGDVVLLTDAVNGTISVIIDADNLKIRAVRRDEFIVQFPVRGV